MKRLGEGQYVRRQLLVMVVLAVAVLGCDAVTSPSGVPLLGSVDPAGSPASSGDAPAYLKAATKWYKAAKKAEAVYEKSSQNLRATKRLFRGYAAVDLAFMRAACDIPWTGEPKPIARRLLSCWNKVYAYEAGASKAKSFSSLDVSADRADRQGAKCSGVANELRLELGLDPVPLR
jgi:hypothetical protein